MRWDGFIDADTVRKTIEILKPAHQLFEVRLICSDKKKIISGYFTDVDVLLAAFDKVDMRGIQAYITLGEVNRSLYSRTQKDRFVANVSNTSDKEIISYQWLFIDFDPVRPTGISSTDEELAKARELHAVVKLFLREAGFSEPVEAMSGNGYHLLYKVNIPANDDSTELVSRFLTTLQSLFKTPEVDIDTTTSNPARVCKLWGTLAQKGANDAERPHRMSQIISVPSVISETGREKIEAVVAELPQVETGKNTKAPAPAFDIRDWLSTYGIRYREDIGRDCQIFALDECPFDHSHRNGDSKIFAYTNGAIAFKCHHNSCKRHKWQDVRLMFEPDAYDEKDDSRIDEAYQRHKAAKILAEQKRAEEEQKSKKVKIRKLKPAANLLEKDLPDPVVLVGNDGDEPLLVEGTCIISAKPKLGKSWFVLAMCLAVANGETFLGYKTKKKSTLYLDLETSEQLQQKRIRKALNGGTIPKNFYLDTETNNLDGGFVEQIEAYMQEDPNIGIVVIDVFQIIRSKAASARENEYEHVYRDITPLNELANKYHIAIILVCHDRKAVDPDDPFSNILGSTGLQGAATQMMVMFRRKKDEPIHISIKGKTIDALPELDVNLNNGVWEVAAAVNSAESEKAALLDEYLNSNIRRAVVAITTRGAWSGRCSQLVNDAVGLGIPIEEDNKHIGGFLHRHQGRFLSQDDIQIQIISHGSASKVYKFSKSTIPTIPNEGWLPFPDDEKTSNHTALENPFL